MIGGMRPGGFIKGFDLEAAERNADSQSSGFTKTGSSKIPYLFSIPIADSNEQNQVERNGGGEGIRTPERNFFL